MATRTAADAPARIFRRPIEVADTRWPLAPSPFAPRKPLDAFGHEAPEAPPAAGELPKTRSGTLGWHTEAKLDVAALDRALALPAHPSSVSSTLGAPLPASDPLLRPTADLPGREALRSKLIAQLLSTATRPPQGQQPTVWVLGGPVGSGKGAVLEKLERAGIIGPGVVRADADLVHGMIPECQALIALGDGRAWSVVHREASELTRELTAQASAQGFDLLLNLTLSSTRRLDDLEALKRAGYRVVVIAVSSGVERSLERASAGGRYVPMHGLLESHRDFANTLDAYLSLSDEAAIIDHDHAVPHVAAVLDGQALLTYEPKHLETMYAKRDLDLSAVPADEVK